MIVFGLRNNCELLYAYLGAMAGLLTGILLIGELMPPLNSKEGISAALLVSAFALITVCAIFFVFYRQRLGPLLISLFVPALVIGVVVYAVALLISSPLLQPAVMFGLGALIGQVIGRILCSHCRDGEFRQKPDSTALKSAIDSLESLRRDVSAGIEEGVAEDD